MHRRISLWRALIAAVALATMPLAAQPQARIKIDTDREIGQVDPLLFGNFSEHLGRVIYGGIYDEGNPLSDKDGYRTDVMKGVKELGVTILRWPGGNFASGYNWKDGIGPKDKRPVRPDYAWGGVESNRFGTDEFLKYCERVGVEPYVCINAGLASVEDARHWVEYTNEKRHTYWADQRRKNGRDEPYKVKYWGLGNEIDGPWQMGHKNAEDYSKFAREAGKAMRWTDNSIKLIASGSSNFGRDANWVEWNRTVLTELNGLIDYISLHTYIGNRDNNLEKFLAASNDVDERIEVTAGLIKAAQTRDDARPVAIAFDEWNVWYRSGGCCLEEIYDFEDGLAMGMFLNSFIRHADVVKMANLAQLVNGIAPMFTNKDGIFYQPTFFPVAEYSRQGGNAAIDVLVDSPAYKTGKRTARYLDVSCTYDKKGKQLFVNVLNRSEKQDIAARIENVTGKIGDSAEVWEFNHPDLKATHTFGNDHKVRPVTKTLAVAAQNGGFGYTFPAHSLSILKLKVQ